MADVLEDQKNLFLPSLNNDLVQEYTVIKKRYVVNFDSDVEEACNYRKVFDVLRLADEGDEVIFVVNTNGGDVNTFVELFNLMMRTKAKTIAELNIAYSLGAYICLACDEIHVSDFSGMMLHSFLCSYEGKVADTAAHTKYLEKSSLQISENLLQGFLTKDEICQVNKGKDFWFTSDQIVKRLKKWIPVRMR